MKPLVFSIPDSNQSAWLDQVAQSDVLRVLELPCEYLDTPSQWQSLSDRGLTVAAARDLIAPEAMRNLSGLSETHRNQLLSLAGSRLARLREHGVGTVVFDFGIGRHAGDDTSSQFGLSVRFLRDLMVAAAPQDVNVCLQARFPFVFPQSPQWDLIGNLIHEVMHPNCRLTLDLFASELEDGFEEREFLRQCGYHLSVLRFCFEPMAGQKLLADSASAWRNALANYLFKGLVVLRPVGEIPVEKIESVRRSLETQAELIIIQGESADDDFV